MRGDSFFKKFNFDGQQKKGAVPEKGVLEGCYVFFKMRDNRASFYTDGNIQLKFRN